MQQIEMMRCDRKNMTLSVPGCVRLWKSAQESRPQEHEGRYACFTCQIGAGHAGVNLPKTAEASEFLRRICPRCERPASRFIGGEMCVSCYNRQREVRIGKNGKGTAPVLLLGKLHSEIVVRVGSDGSSGLIERRQVIGVGEVIVSEARLAQSPVAFSRATLRPVSPQFHLLSGPLLIPPPRLIMPKHRTAARHTQLCLSLAA